LSQNSCKALSITALTPDRPSVCAFSHARLSKELSKVILNFSRAIKSNLLHENTPTDSGTAASSAYAGEKVPPGGRVVNDFFCMV